MDEQTATELNELNAIQAQPVSPALAKYPRTAKLAMEGGAENLDQNINRG